MSNPGSKKPDYLNFAIPNSTFYFGLLFTVIALAVTMLVDSYYHFHIEFRDYLTLFSSGVICTTLVYHSKNVALTYKYHQEKLALDMQKMEDDRMKGERETDRKKLSSPSRSATTGSNHFQTVYNVQGCLLTIAVAMAISVVSLILFQKLKVIQTTEKL